MAKRRIVRANLGGKLRLRAVEPRRNFLYIEVTDRERNAIQDYCVKHQLSLSQFLAELMLEDAANPKRTEKVVLTPKLEFTPDEAEKLELLVMLYGKESLDELIRDLLQPNLDMQKIHTNRKTRFVRFYLSEEEHQQVATHIASKSIPMGKYGAMVALKAIRKTRNA